MNSKNTLAAILFLSLTFTASAQVLFIASMDEGTVGSYHPTTGEPINPALITGLASPYGIAHDATALYVSNASAGTVGKYDIETGAVIASPLVSGLNSPSGLAVHNGILYVGSTAGSVSSHHAETGETINASLISAGGVRMLGIHNDRLYVSDFVNHVVGLYTLEGKAIKADFARVANPGGIAFSGASLFVTSSEENAVMEFNAETGELIAKPVSSGLSDPIGLAATSDGHLLVANLTGGRGSVSRFLLDGMLVDNPFIVGMATPVGLDYLPAPTP